MPPPGQKNISDDVRDVILDQLFPGKKVDQPASLFPMDTNDSPDKDDKAADTSHVTTSADDTGCNTAKELHERGTAHLNGEDNFITLAEEDREFGSSEDEEDEEDQKEEHIWLQESPASLPLRTRLEMI